MTSRRRHITFLVAGTFCCILAAQVLMAVYRPSRQVMQIASSSSPGEQAPAVLEGAAIDTLDAALASGQRSDVPTALAHLQQAELLYTHPNDRHRVRCFTYLALTLLGQDGDASALFPRWQDRASASICFDRPDSERLEVLRAIRADDNDYVWTTEPHLAEVQLVNWGGLNEHASMQNEGVAKRLLDWKLLWPGASVGEVGAGIGGLSWTMAEYIGSGGKVYVNELNPGLCEAMKELSSAGRRASPSFAEVLVVRATHQEPGFPRHSLDLVVIENTFHAMLPNRTWLWDDSRVRAHLLPYLVKLRESLKPGGKLAIIDFSPEPQRIEEILALAGLKCVRTEPFGHDSAVTVQVFVAKR